MKPRIGWIGTGVMGKSMAANLLRAGYVLSVHNRTQEKAQPLSEMGAVLKNSPAEIAEVSDVVFLMVGYPADVRSVILGENGVLQGFQSVADHPFPPTVVDMTTSSPAVATEIYTECKKRGIDALDAPVSGGDTGAKSGSLSIMVGGDALPFERLMPIFRVLGNNIVHQGGAGSGQHTKMVNQILIAGNMVGMCEALLYATHAGLDTEKVMRSVATGAAGSWSLSNPGHGFSAAILHLVFSWNISSKDMKIARRDGAYGIVSSGTRSCPPSLRTVGRARWGTPGTQALINVWRT